MFAISEAMISRSKDNGKTWDRYTYKAFTFGDIAFHPQNPDVIFLAFEEGVAKTTDRGNNWKGSQKIARNIDKVLLDARNPDILYALDNILYVEEEATGSSVYRSTDGGESWHLYYELIYDEKVGWPMDVVCYRNKMFFYTNRAKVFYLDLDDLTVSAERQIHVPQLREYPNPVRDILHFETEENLDRVVIADMSGRVVKTKTLSGSEREISVSDLRAGMYAVCFYTNNGSVWKKIAVMK